MAAAGGTWREAGRLSEQQLARMVREDRIDILVELTGAHATAAHNALHTLQMMLRVAFFFEGISPCAQLFPITVK